MENKKAALECILLADPCGTFFGKYPPRDLPKNQDTH